MKQSEKKQINESYEFDESYYDYIGSRYIDIIDSDLNQSSTCVDEMIQSDSLNDWFHQYNNRKNKKTKIIEFSKKMSKVAVLFIAIIVCSLYLLSTQVEGFKVKIMNLIVDDNESYTSVTVEEDTLKLLDNFDEDIYVFDYLPNGYKFLSIENYNSTYILKYEKDGNVIIFGQAPNGTDFQFDTENATKNNINLNDQDILHIYKENHMMFWHNQEYSFYLISNIDINEIKKCIINIKIY